MSSAFTATAKADPSAAERVLQGWLLGLTGHAAAAATSPGALLAAVAPPGARVFDCATGFHRPDPAQANPFEFWHVRVTHPDFCAGFSVRIERNGPSWAAMAWYERVAALSAGMGAARDRSMVEAASLFDFVLRARTTAESNVFLSGPRISHLLWAAWHLLAADPDLLATVKATIALTATDPTSARFYPPGQYACEHEYGLVDHTASPPTPVAPWYPQHY